MNRVMFGFGLGVASSIVLAGVVQERAIAASNEEVNSLIKKFAREAQDSYARSYRDSRLPRQKEWVNAFKASWAKSDPEAAQFLGDWSAIEENKKIYPSKTKGKVCIIDTFLSRSSLGYEFSQGEIKNNRVYTDKGVILFLANTNKGKILGTIFKRPDNGQLGTYGYAYPKPLINPSQVSSTANDYDNISQLAPQFNAAGCTTDMYEGAISAKPRSNTPTYATNLGGSTYFSWQWQTNSGASESSEPRIVAGYGCVTRNQIAGVAPRQAFANRYKLIRFRGTDEWALEFVEGISVKPTEKGYVAQKLSGMPGKELQKYVTDRESGFLKKEMGAADGLGLACINDGMAGVLKSIRQEYNIAIDVPGELTTDEPIAQPTEPVKTHPPIARASTYAYPSPEEFTQLRQTLKTQPSQKLSAADNQSRQAFLKKWQTDNPPIAPFIGTWTTREGRSIYVYPSTQRLRACVVTVKDGNPSFTMALAQGPELRYGNSGLFKTEQGDLLASRQEGEKDLVPVFAAVGVPVLSEDVQQELAQAKCGGMAIGPAGR